MHDAWVQNECVRNVNALPFLRKVCFDTFGSFLGLHTVHINTVNLFKFIQPRNVSSPAALKMYFN